MPLARRDLINKIISLASDHLNFFSTYAIMTYVKVLKQKQKDTFLPFGKFSREGPKTKSSKLP